MLSVAKVLTAKRTLVAAMLFAICACMGESEKGHENRSPHPDKDHAPTPESPSVEPGQIAIKVTGARQLSDSSDLQISAWLANGAGGRSVTLASTQFQVMTEDGLLILPEPVSPSDQTMTSQTSSTGASSNAHEVSLPDRLVDGVDPVPTTSLTGGHSVLLRLSFDLRGRKGTSLVFTEFPGQDVASKDLNAGHLRKAEISFVIDEGTQCDGKRTYLDLDRNNCGACGIDVGIGTCEKGVANKISIDLPESCGIQGHVCAAVAPAGTLTQCSSELRCEGTIGVELSDANPDTTCAEFCYSKGFSCADDLMLTSGHGERGGLLVKIEGRAELHSCETLLSQVMSIDDQAPPATAACECMERVRR